MQREQNTKQPLRKRKTKKKSALTASRAIRTKYSQRNRKHHKGNAEQRLALRKDQCLYPLHQDTHHQEEQPGEALPAEGERAALRTDQLRGQSQEEACPEKPSEEAHPVQSTGIPPPAGQGLPTAQKTTTTTTDHHRSIRHRIAHLQQEGEQTSTQPALLATKWSKK